MARHLSNLKTDYSWIYIYTIMKIHTVRKDFFTQKLACKKLLIAIQLLLKSNGHRRQINYTDRQKKLFSPPWENEG
jgi:hypothetical protein